MEIDRRDIDTKLKAHLAETAANETERVQMACARVFYQEVFIPGIEGGEIQTADDMLNAGQDFMGNDGEVRFSLYQLGAVAFERVYQHRNEWKDEEQEQKFLVQKRALELVLEHYSDSIQIANY